MSQTQDSIGLTKEGLRKVQQRMSELEKPDNSDRKGWSQPDLVKMSYTSDSTVKRFLKRTPISRQCFIGIATALGIEPEEIADPKAWNRTTGNPELNQSSDIDWQEVCRAMLEAKRELASNLFTSGMGIKFELDDIHVPLGLVERPQKVQRRDDASPEEGSRVYREEKEKITPIDYDDFFQQVLANQQSPKSNGKRLNIIGEPGAGKTTQLLKIADWLLDETEDLPIWISLGVVGEKPLQEYLLKDWLRDAAGKLDAAPPEWVEQLEQHLKDGRVWLLLDGADEMQAAAALRKLAEFFRIPLLKNARVVLTCRLNLWEAAGNALSEFDTYKMLDFSYGDGKNSDQVKQFIDKWFGNSSPVLPYKDTEQEASHRVEGTEGGEQLRKALDKTGKERIKDLARHPLRLALLCFTWQSGRGKLPDTKAELYEMFVEALYILKKGVFPTTSAQQRDLNAALGQLALKAIDKGIKSILPHSLVYEELEKPYPELFELADKLGWLNIVADEPENPLKSVYAFFHPTFQEYFAACAIPDWDFFLPRTHVDRPVTDKDNPEKYKRYRIFESQWKEVFLLWIGQPKEKVSHKHKDELIKALINFDDGCKDFYHYRAYFLASEGISEYENCSCSDEVAMQLIQLSLSYFNYGKPIRYLFDIGEIKIRFDTLGESAREALIRTNRSKAITLLAYFIRTNQDELIRLELARVLIKCDYRNTEALETLLKLEYTSNTTTIKEIAREILRNASISDEVRIHTLIHLLYNSTDENTRKKLISGLVNIGAYDPEVITILNQLLQNSTDDRIYKDITDCLNRISHKIPDRTRHSSPELINELIHLLHSSQDENIRLEAASKLACSGCGNSEAITALVRALDTEPNESIRKRIVWSLQIIGRNSDHAHSEVIPCFRRLLHSQDSEIVWRSVKVLLKFENTSQEALKVLADQLYKAKNDNDLWSDLSDLMEIIWEDEVCIGNSDLIETLTKIIYTTSDDNIRNQVAYGLAKIDPGNLEAINTLINLLCSISQDKIDDDDPLYLGEVCRGNSNAIDSLTNLLQSSQDEQIRWRIAASLGQVDPGNLTASYALISLLHNTHNEDIRQAAAWSLGQIGANNIEAIAALVYWLRNTQEQETRRIAAESLEEILKDNYLTEVVSGLKDYITQPVDENNFEHYQRCYQIVWNCAQNMPYPKFYQVWHKEYFPLSVEVQTLESQNLDFNQLQPTEHTYPLAINLLSLKGEIEKRAIAQKLCNKIYKHHAVKIPGKPPTVKSDAELQQHLFEIQEKLQRPNLAFVLYIKDTNGFHEPIEEAIAFCQKLADPDLGIHIAWITNQSLEQPLKDIQPDRPKLISKIQSWIDEIV
jgi:HEAT repeat protein